MDQKTALLERLRIDRTRVRRSGRGRSRWLLGVAALAFVAVGGALFVALSPAGVPIHTVVAKAIVSSTSGSTGGSLLDASGYVIALREAFVSGKNIYKVDEVLIQEGQHVKQGQILAKLDDTNTRAELEHARAQVRQTEAVLAAAKLAVEDARPIFLRNQTQRGEGLISQEAFDASKSAYDAAQTAEAVAEQNLSVAKASVAVNQRLEDDTTIMAPFDAVVTQKMAQPGQIVSPQFSGGGGIAKIVDMDSLEVEVDVNESFITRVHPQQPAIITLNAYPDWRIPAEVIAIIPTADRTKGTVKVRVGFKEKNSHIVPEMDARVSFLEDGLTPHTGDQSPAPIILVPPGAILADGDTGVVFVVNGDAAERRVVRLGTRNQDGQTVLSGLVAGEILATGDLSQLSDGSRVRTLQ